MLYKEKRRICFQIYAILVNFVGTVSSKFSFKFFSVFALTNYEEATKLVLILLTVYFLLKKCRRIKVKLTKDKCIKKCLDKKCILLFRFEDNSNLYYQFYLLCNFMKFSWLSNVTGYETSWFIHQVVAI